MYDKGLDIPFLPVGIHCSKCSFTTPREMDEGGVLSGVGLALLRHLIGHKSSLIDLKSGMYGTYGAMRSGLRRDVGSWISS